MDKRISIGFAFGLLLSVVPASAQVARADEFRCTAATPAPPVVNGNLLVPRNAVCSLQGTSIRGNVKVEEGAELSAREMTLAGNLQGERFVLVDVVNSTVDGNIQLHAGRAVFIDDLLVRGNDVDGNVEIEAIWESVDLNGDNTISGNLKLINNTAAVDVSRNRVGKHVQLVENTGGVTVADNVIGRHLECEKNNPAPVGGGDIAGKKQGQCASL